MNITAQDIGKKYGKNWIFRHLNFEVTSDSRIAITGKNGAGKSTLLQIISGFLTPSEGVIHYDGEIAEIEKVNTAFIGPYMEIIEEFTLKEFLDFHSKFKSALIEKSEMAERASLPLTKPILDFSTGMKQRAKLITAFFFKNDLICMDEPTSNLDAEGFEWWKREVEDLKNTTVVIASNQKNEIDLCNSSLDLSN